MINLNRSRKLAARPRAGCFLALFLLAGLLALVTPLRADNPPTYLFQIDAAVVPGGFEPVCVALDSSNNLYVTDYLNFRIVKLSSVGAYLTQWNGPVNSQLEYPIGIAVDSSNNVYVANLESDCVEKFDSNGNYLMQWGSYGSGNGPFANGRFDGPVGVAVDSGNNVYVADQNNDRIQKFDSNGNYLMQWGSYGSGNGQFNWPEDIAVDSGNNVYVADWINTRIEKFDSNGNYLTQWGTNGSGNGQFNGPVGVAVDSGNNVYVADQNNDRIQKFDSNGSYLAQWGTNGSGDGQFASPDGVAVDSTGNFIYVTDSGNERIEVFVNNPNIVPPIIRSQPTSQTIPVGTNVTLSLVVVGGAPFAYQWSSNNVAIPGATNVTFTLTNVSLAMSGNYSVLVTNSYGGSLSSNAVVTILPAAKFVVPTYLFQVDASAVPGESNPNFNPNFVALDTSNNVYVDLGQPGYNDSVVKLSSSGTYLTQWGGYGIGNGQFEGPSGIAVDSSNNVYVADWINDRIQKFDSNGNYLTQWGSYGSGNGQFEYHEGIAVNSSNNVYVTDLENNRVEKFDSNGSYLMQWGSAGSGNGQFDGPAGIAVDSGNNVYVADSGNSRIQKFDSNGNYLTQWGSSGSGNGQFEYPEGIAVDSGNDVYVADSGNFRIQKFDSNGNFLTQWGSYGTGNGQFAYPEGVAVDSTGNLIYVTDPGNGRIEVFANNVNNLPPYITIQPVSQIVPGSINVTFSVSVAGGAPFAYQWVSNNVVVPGATNASFTLSHVILSDSANYSVLVTNGYGSALSGTAVLAVLPVVAITQPASGHSATGAVLNGSVTLGSDETVAWFEWGTDTNYGNIAGITIEPGNNGSNNISAALSGLPGNFYHYRMDAANDFGIVYGGDQPFTVGFAPTATTHAAVNSTNGWTLNATVNPNGWDTTVYFTVSDEFSFYTTTSVDIGAGTTPLNVNSFITGLTANEYRCQVVASNDLGVVGEGIGSAVTFTTGFDSIPSKQFAAIASSADGRVLVAVSTRQIYISTNFGVFWTQATNAPTLDYMPSVACSADGRKIIAADANIPIYTSSDTGATWVPNNALVQFWSSVASSADGTKLAAAAARGGYIYTSADSGATWTQATNAPTLQWGSIASSADGSKLAAADTEGSSNIYTSTDFGVTWITNNLPGGFALGYAVSIASSADGSKLVAATYSQYFPSSGIFISTNSGATWAQSATNIYQFEIFWQWACVASSADGRELAAISASRINNADGTSALSSGGLLITSTNSGVTWNPIASQTWSAVALSADGARLVATVGPPTSTGYPFYPFEFFYLSQTTPSPKLNLSASDNNAAISWIIPSLNFTLQQSSNLTSWTDVTNQPVLNLTNLQNQVVLPPPNGNSFFRLTH